MKKLFLIISSLLFLLFGCGKENDDFVYREYPLPEFFVRNLEGEDRDRLAVINDQTHFLELFSGANVWPVDFNKYTLLLVASTPPGSGVEELQGVVLRDKEEKYRVEITAWYATEGITNWQPWNRAFVIPKTKAEDVTLEVTYYPSTTNPE